MFFSELDLRRLIESSGGRALCLAFVSGFSLMVGCHRGEAPASQQMRARPPAQVTVAPAIARDVPVYLDEIGKAVAIEIVTIVPQVGGKVIAAHVQDGAYVKKGQLLFEIDPRPFQAALASAEATLAQGKAELDWARIEFNRVKGLLSADSASQLEFEQKRVALAVSEAQVQGAEAAIDTARLNLEYTRIQSPVDGRAGARLVDPGNVVRSNDAPMMVVQRLDPIYVEFTITENDLNTVRRHMAHAGQGGEAGLRVEVDVPSDTARVLSALGGPAPETRPEGTRPGPREGQLTFLDNSVQSGTGTVRLRATVRNEDRYFWPGQFVNVRLVLAMQRNAILVSSQAQQVGQQGPYVYVVKPDNTADIRPIVPGQRHGDLIVVEQGLQAGEPVVVSGQMSIMPGGPVVIAGQGPGPGGGPPGGSPPGATAKPQAAATAPSA